MSFHVLGSILSQGRGIVFPHPVFIVIAVLSVFHVIKKIVVPVIRNYRLAKFLDNLLGGEPRHWFYGHIKKYPVNEKGMLRIVDRARRFPFVCNGWIGPFLPEIMVFHPDSIKAVFSSYAPKNEITYRVMRPWIGDGLLTSSGKKWLRNRRLITPAFHYNILKPYLKIFNDSARIFLNNLKFEVGHPVEISERISLMTLDTMLRCAMSFETECQNIKGKHPYIAAIKVIADSVMTRIENPLMLVDFIFSFTSEGRKFKKATDFVHEQAEKVIAKRRAILAENERMSASNCDGRKYLDFLDILLETKDEHGRGLTDQEIRDEVDTFLFEGHDTTASAISWICYNLAKHPEFQEKCREEVVALLQERNDVEWSDLSQLHYLTMFIKESMRLHSPVPAVGRYLKEPLLLPQNEHCDVTVPPKVNVAIPIFALHRHPLVWEDPEIFDPERFTLENISKRSPHAFLPFSAGPRNCIGQNFAMNEIKTVICQLVSTYRLYLDHETKPPIMKPQLVLGTEEGIFVKLALL